MCHAAFINAIDRTCGIRRDVRASLTTAPISSAPVAILGIEAAPSLKAERVSLTQWPIGNVCEDVCSGTKPERIRLQVAPQRRIVVAEVVVV
jgi:hypothetical protein